MSHPLAADLDFVLANAPESWKRLRGSRLFVTGGTRFFGAWLLESLLRADEKLGLDAEVVILTRDPEGFKKRAPRLAVHDSLRLHQGDVRSFEYPQGGFSHVIHGAASLNNETDAALTRETLVGATERVLEFARQAGVKNVLFISSGAVYGRQPPGITHMNEEHEEASDCPLSHYAQGKLDAERLCARYHERFGIETKIARAFTFAGPHLPIDRHNALGNFIRDGLSGGPIRITGDGTPRRSYLYGADLALWLWTILTQGAPGRPYNVGSEMDQTLAEVAALVARHFKTTVEISKKAVPGAPVDRYVPSTRRAQIELGLKEHIGLEEAVSRMARWESSP